MYYKHTQIGTLILFALLIFILFFGFLLTKTGFNSTIIILMFIILAILASFSLLKVTIDKKYLRIKFGWGIFSKGFLLKEINSVKIVKNHWYYGWGIRLWLWPYMWIYNVSGFDAIEIILKNGKRFRVGTDEPKKLMQAISKSIKK